MSNRIFAIATAIFLLATTSFSVLHAQTMDVDQADTIDFQAFHKDKKEAIKAWDKKSDQTVKTYSDQSGDKKAADAAATSTEISAAPTATDTKTAALAGTTSSGKRFEIRERYTLTRSAKTPYSAFYVIEPLYKQAAQLCAKGWKKLAERSEPVEQDFYLYYEIECL